MQAVGLGTCLAIRVEIWVDPVAMRMEEHFGDAGWVVRAELDVEEEELVVVGRSCSSQNRRPHHIHPAHGEETRIKSQLATGNA